MKRSLGLVAIAFAAIWILGAKCSLDGDTYTLNLTNDTQEMLVMCARDCDSSPTRPRQVEPGEYALVSGAVGHGVLWQVRDLEDNILGCFIYDFDERPKIEERYVSTDLVPCP